MLEISLRSTSQQRLIIFQVTASEKTKETTCPAQKAKLVYEDIIEGRQGEDAVAEVAEDVEEVAVEETVETVEE